MLVCSRGLTNIFVPVPRCLRSAQFLPSNDSRFVASTSSGSLHLYDLETGDVVFDFLLEDDVGGIFCIACHESNPTVVVACGNNELRFYDSTTGECEHAMTAHGDSVTSVSFDSSGLYLVSSGLFAF